MANKTDQMVIIAPCEVAFLWKSLLRDCAKDLGHFQVSHAALEMIVSILIMSSPPACPD